MLYHNDRMCSSNNFKNTLQQIFNKIAISTGNFYRIRICLILVSSNFTKTVVTKN